MNLMTCEKCLKRVTENTFGTCLGCLGGFSQVFGIDDESYQKDKEYKESCYDYDERKTIHYEEEYKGK